MANGFLFPPSPLLELYYYYVLTRRLRFFGRRFSAALLPIEVFGVGVFPSCHSVSEARPEHIKNLEQRCVVAMIDCHGNDR